MTEEEGLEKRKKKKRREKGRRKEVIRTEADGERKGKKICGRGEEGKSLYGGASEKITLSKRALTLDSCPCLLAATALRVAHPRKICTRRTTFWAEPPLVLVSYSYVYLLIPYW